jgi:hypothetical protein
MDSMLGVKEDAVPAARPPDRSARNGTVMLYLTTIYRYRQQQQSATTMVTSDD